MLPAAQTGRRSPSPCRDVCAICSPSGSRVSVPAHRSADQRDRRRRAGSRRPGATPLKIALDTGNIHHFLVGAQGALPVDAVGNPWSGSYVYNSGNLVLDLLYNLMLESTGRLQKCRIYEMTDNKAARSTIA